MYAFSQITSLVDFLFDQHNIETEYYFLRENIDRPLFCVHPSIHPPRGFY